MEPSEVQALLNELPVIGPLFSGSAVAVALRLVGLIVAIIVGIKLLRWAWGRNGAPPVESKRSLVKQGRFEEAGDLCSRRGDLEAALDHYKKGKSWLRAGHTARRLGRFGDAAGYFEQANEIKLAVASFEAAGMEREMARLAEKTNDPSLLAKAGKWFESKGDPVKAGGFFAMAGMLKEAEQCFLRGGDVGRSGAIQMYIDAFETRSQFEGRSHGVRELALRAAQLMHEGGQQAQAVQLCHRGGIDPALLNDASQRTSSSSRPQSRPVSQQSSDLAGHGSAAHRPIAEASEAAFEAGEARKARTSSRPDELFIDAPLLSADSFLDSGSDVEPVIATPEAFNETTTAPPEKSAPPQKRALAIGSSQVAGARRSGRKKSKTQEVADALLMVLEEEEGADEALELLPSELRQEVSEEAVTMDMTSPSDSLSSVLGAGVDSATKFSSDVTDRYSILGEIGVGGMGEVYKAKDLSLGREVALKFLSAAMVGDDNALNLFLREARAAAALNHPTIVTVYDIGVLDHRPFICMEYVEGTDLATRLKEESTIDVGEALGITIQLAKALDYAHERNVVHRDIKPSNVIQTSEGVVKILDFGLAKAIQGNKKKSTYVAGTPEYMSPEQLAGRKVDGRGDLFSLGVVLYELTTGSLPFEGALRSSNFEPPSARAEWLSPALDDVIRKALALAPVDRFQRGTELIDALRQLEGRG